MSGVLDELYGLLKQHGFVIGIDDHLRINRLVEREGTWTLETLRIAVESLVTTDVRDRPAFAAAWSAWLATRPVVVAGTAPEALIASIAQRPSGMKRPVLMGIGVLALAVGATSIVVALRSGDEHGHYAEDQLATLASNPGPGSGTGSGTGPGTGDAGSGTGTGTGTGSGTGTGTGTGSGTGSGTGTGTGTTGTGTGDGSGGFRSGVGSGAGDAIGSGSGSAHTPTPAEHPALAQLGRDESLDLSSPSTAAVTGPAAASTPPAAPAGGDLAPYLALFATIAGALVGVIAFVVALATRRGRRRFVPGPWTYRVHTPAPVRPVIPRLAIEDTAADLTFHAEQPSLALDIERTVARTTESGGRIEPVFERPRGAPSYVVLEDVGAGSEPWRFLYDEVLRGLAREGVALERYTFHDSPETCRSREGRAVALRDLLEHADALVVIGNGDAALEPSERADDDRVADWVPLLRQVGRRIWINPVPPARWSAGARAVSRDTPMEHGVARAIARLHGGAPSSTIARPYPAIVDRAPASATAHLALRAYLGDPAYRLVCALAIATPTPSISAARWLAERMGVLLDEDEWLAIAQLPWIARETWPSGVRERMRVQLRIDAPALAIEIESAADELIANSEPPDGSAAHLAWELAVATRLAERGDKRRAAVAASRVVASPLAPIARRTLAALGLSDHRTRALGALAVLATALVLLGLDPLASLATEPPPPRLGAASGLPPTGVVEMGSSRVRLEGIAVTSLPGDEIEILFSVEVTDVRGRGVPFDPTTWVVFDEIQRGRPIELTRTARPVDLLIVVERSIADRVVAPLHALVAALPPPSVVRFLAFDEVVEAVSAPPTDMRVAMQPPTLRGAIDRAIRARPHRILVVGTGADDGVGPSPHTLAERAQRAGIPIDTIGWNEEHRRALLSFGELSRTSGGRFAWVPSGDFRVAVDDVRSQLVNGTTIVLRCARDNAPRTLRLSVGTTTEPGHSFNSTPAIAVPPIANPPSAFWVAARLVLRIVALLAAALALFELVRFAIAMRR